MGGLTVREVVFNTFHKEEKYLFSPILELVLLFQELLAERTPPYHKAGLTRPQAANARPTYTPEFSKIMLILRL